MSQWSPVRVGLCVTSASVSAVALGDGAVVWWDEVDRDAETDLAAAIHRLLVNAPRGRLAHPIVYVGVGPSAAQLRNVGSIADAKDATLVLQIVRANLGRFFLVNGIPLRATRPQWAPRGGAWVGAIEQPVVDAILAGGASARTRVALIAPAATSLGHATRGDTVAWRDGTVRVEVLYQGDVVTSYRRTFGHPDADRPWELVPALSALGESAERFAPAYAIARAGSRAALTIDFAPAGQTGASRVALAGAMCGLSLGVALLLPGLANRHRAELARREAAVLSSSLHGDDEIEHDLAERAGLLRELGAFQGGTMSPTLFLASLTTAIEAPAVVQSLQLDSLGGVLIASAPRAALLVAMLDSMPQIGGLHITGAVTLDAGPAPGISHTGDDEPPMEHVTLRFTWRNAPAHMRRVSGR
jgi:hypothetical protein